MTDLHSTGASVDLFSDNGSGSSIPVTGEQIGRSPGAGGRGREPGYYTNRPVRADEHLTGPSAARRSRSRAGAMEPSTVVTVLGYLRVSTEEQGTSGAGLASQRAAINDEVERRGWHLLDIIEDAGYSGRDLRRPGIVAVLEALKRGEASVLMVAKLDRLSRSMLDFAALMDQAARERWALVALDVNVDTTTPAGEAMANVMLSFAVLERRLIGERTRAALAQKRAQGVRLGRPFSLPDTVVKRVIAERKTGRSPERIARQLNADEVPTAHGGRQWHPSTIRAVLRSAERRARSPRPVASPDQTAAANG